MMNPNLSLQHSTSTLLRQNPDSEVGSVDNALHKVCI